MKILNALKWIVGIPREPELRQLGVPLDSASKETLALKKENASLKAQIGTYVARDIQTREKQVDDDKEEEIKKELNEQADKIYNERFGEVISLKNFFFQYFNNAKFRETMEFTDKDDKISVGKFGDICISTKSGVMILTDSDGNPLNSSYDIRGLIFKPESLHNQFKRGRILLPKDENMNYIPDMENLEANDIIYDENANEFRETKEFRDTVKNLLIKRDLKLREKENYIERLEKARTEDVRTIKDLKMSMEVYKSNKQATESELSMAVKLNSQSIAKNGEFARQIANLSQYKSLMESKIIALESVNNRILEKLEQADKTIYEKIKSEVQDDLQIYKNILPEKVTIEAPEPESVRVMPQVGQQVSSPIQKRV